MSDIDNNPEKLRAYLLAEFRCAALRAKLAANDLVVNRELPKGAVPSVAIIAAMISGAATVEALFRAHW